MSFDEFMLAQNDLARDAAYALLNALVGCDVSTLDDDEEPAVEEDLDSIESLIEAAERELDELGLGDMICRPSYSLYNKDGEEKRVPCYLNQDEAECKHPDCPYKKLFNEVEK